MDSIQRPLANEFELRSIVVLLRRQMRTILLTTFVVFALALAFLMTVTQTFTATTLILIDPDRQNILNPGAGYPATAGRDNARVDSEIEILKSDAVALSVIASENLIADSEFGLRLSLRETFAQTIGVAHAAPVSTQRQTAITLARFKEATTIRRRGLTYLVTVSTTSQSPARAAILSNELARAYIEQQVQAKIARASGARDVLGEQIISARRSLTSFESAFDRFVDNNTGALSIDPNNDHLAGLRAELVRAEQERSEKQSAQSAARLLRQQGNWSALAGTFGDGLLSNMGDERQKLLAIIADPKEAQRAHDFHADLANLDLKMKDQSAAGLRKISTQIDDLDQSISGIRGQMRQAVLSSDLSPGMLTDLYAIQQETSVARAQYDNLLLRMRDLETQARIQIADSRVVSPALEPISASFPNRSLAFLVALAVSAGLGVSLAFLKEYYIGGVTSGMQLSELMQTPTATSIPFTPIPHAGQKSIAGQIIDAPLSVYSESIRRLRAAIDQTFRPPLRPGETKALASGKIVLITSALSDEGKTTTALSLARTYAQAGRKTLLIDADLRRPSLHRHLGFEPQVGFLDYLQNATNTQLGGSFYARDPASSLALIMGASRSEFPTDQLLSSATFEALLAQAKEVYDLVIIDSPPLLPVVDARYIAHYADAVVMVTKWAATGQMDIKSAVQPLRDAMKPGAALLPVLTQVQGQPNRREDGGYSEVYSAAI